MKKRIIVLILILNIFVYSKKIIVLNEIAHPSNIHVTNDYIYIVEETEISIYSLKDYKFKKKFGKSGEGPKEFKLFAVIIPQDDYLLINSLGKISYFTFMGKHIKEIKPEGDSYSVLYYPLKDGFIGGRLARKYGKNFISINKYNINGKKIDKITEIESPSQGNRKIELLKNQFSYQTYKNKVYISGINGFNIDVFNSQCYHIKNINRKYKKRKFSEKDRKIFLDHIKRQFKENFYLVKNKIIFPEYFPEILSFHIADDIIYIATWKRNKNKVEFFLYNLNGRYISTVFVPLLFEDGVKPYPMTIKNSKIYQLFDNGDTEEWEIHISDINI